jgi:hypothetical protein
MKFPLIEFPSKMFTYNKADKTLTCEASTMENRHLQRLYDDACDVGFAVKSDKTNHVIVYVMTSPIYHGQGEDREIGGWAYTVSSESMRKYPECVGTKAVVFNT